MKVQLYRIGGDYSIIPHDNGTVMLARDVLAAIEQMLDDDKQTVSLLLEYRDKIKALMPRGR